MLAHVDLPLDGGVLHRRGYVEAVDGMSAVNATVAGSPWGSTKTRTRTRAGLRE